MNLYQQIIFECKVKYGETAPLVYESVLDTLDELLSDELNESELTMVEVTETPLALLDFNPELMEAMLHFLKDENKLRHDKDGKAIVGMHKDTNRYKGDKKSRDRQKARAYYDRGDNREKQRLRMRKRRAVEANDKAARQAQADREESKERGVTINQIRDERLAAQKKARAEKRAKNQEKINARSAHTRSENKAKKETSKVKDLTRDDYRELIAAARAKFKAK